MEVLYRCLLCALHVFHVEVLVLLVSLPLQGVRGRQCWQVQGSAAEVCGGTGWDQGDTCIHRLSGRAGQEEEDVCVQAHRKKACREVFFLCSKCQSGLVWDSGGAGPSRVRGAQGLGRLKKGLVPCHSQIRGAAQLLGDAVNLILTRGLQHSGYPLIS